MVEQPIIQPRRPKAYQEVEDELSTFVRNTRVLIKPDGEVIVKKNEKDKIKKTGKKRKSIKEREKNKEYKKTGKKVKTED
jgi:predicted PilT family ATPase